MVENGPQNPLANHFSAKTCKNRMKSASDWGEYPVGCASALAGFTDCGCSIGESTAPPDPE